MRIRSMFSVVFQCVIVVFMLSSILFFRNSAAQDVMENKWSKSAKSLTIFQPGDAVRIQIWELYLDDERNLNISADYPINPEGFIIMPLIGEVRVKGMTVFELMQSLEEKYAAYLRNLYIYITPLIRITMQGAFNQPGAYRIPPTSSFWDLVAAAGGPTANCDLPRMYVERGGKTVFEKLLYSFERGYSLEEIGIESGDQVIAPGRRGFNFMFFIHLFNLLTSITLLYLRMKSGQW